MLWFILAIAKRGNKGITNRGKRDYKQGQLKGSQIGAKRLQIAAGLRNRGKGISNQGRDYKSGQERLQTGTGISNRCRTIAAILF